MSYQYPNEPDHTVGTMTTGIRSTIDSGSTKENRQKLDVVDAIFTLEPSKYPLFTLITNIGKDSNGRSYSNSSVMKSETTNPEFSWHEGFYGGRYAKISAVTGTTGALTLSVTGAGSETAYIFTVGDIVRNGRTGENFRVATIGSATTITVTAAGRSAGTTAAATPTVTDGLYIIGNSSEEGATARNINTTRTSKESNYTQIFRRTIGVTGTENATELYGGSDLQEQRRKAFIDHARDIERTIWFGEKSVTTGTNGKPLRTTGGILEFITSNNAYIQDQGGPLTASDFNMFLTEGLTYGSQDKTLFVGGIVSRAIDEIALGQVQTSTGDRKYGLSIRSYETSGGTIKIVRNPEFINDYAGYAFLLDLSCFKLRYMKGRDTHLRTDIQENSADSRIDELLTDVGLQRKLAANNALLKGVTG